MKQVVWRVGERVGSWVGSYLGQNISSKIRSNMLVWLLVGRGPAPRQKSAHDVAESCFSNINSASRLLETPTYFTFSLFSRTFSCLIKRLLNFWSYAFDCCDNNSLFTVSNDTSHFCFKLNCRSTSSLSTFSFSVSASFCASYSVIFKDAEAIKIEECKSSRRRRCDDFEEFMVVNWLVVLKKIDVKILEFRRSVFTLHQSDVLFSFKAVFHLMK